MVEFIFNSIITWSSRVRCHSSRESARLYAGLTSSSNTSGHSSNSDAELLMSIFLVSVLSDWRYASLTSITHIWKPLIFSATRITRIDTHWMICTPWNRKSFLISKCPLATYLASYRYSLQSSGYIPYIYLAIFGFAHSISSTLRTARKISLLTRSCISAYLAYIIWDNLLVHLLAWWFQLIGISVVLQIDLATTLCH